MGVPQLQDIKALGQYIDGVYSSLLYLLLQVSGVKDHQADHAASHVGMMDCAFEGALDTVPD